MDSIDTLSIHAGDPPDPLSGATNIPITMAATYRLPGFGIKLFDALDLTSNRVDHVYTRWSNPTLRMLENRLAAIEGAEAGVSFASGMAAVSAFFFTFLSAGDHIIANDVCYAGSVELLSLHMTRFGVEVSVVDTSDIEQVKAAMRPNTRLIFAETPANPILRIADIQALADIAHSGGAKLVIDSTFATPALQRPLALGADFVIHSLTKYLNGHGDALGGVILGSEIEIQHIRKDMLIHLGGALSPFNAWLILRGLETLALRMEKHCQNAMRIAGFLETHPAVKRVTYPGLESHPHHQLASKQMSAFGGMISFQFKGGIGAAITFSEKTRVAAFATSLGHPNTIYFYYPADMYVEPIPYLTAEQKASIREWTGDGVLRLSVGLENPDDLIQDLDQALRARTFKGMIGSPIYQLIKTRFTQSSEK